MDITEYEFLLKKGEEFIQLNQLLQIIGVAQTGGHAKLMIKDMAITLNGQTETRVRKKLFKGDVIAFGETKIEIVTNDQDEEE